MGKALYRKYRSKSLDEVVGQEHITTTLKNALKSGKISHAYLLTGPRGVGKTSVARILAYEVNGLPYNESAAHLDIIEIDAASNRRIDEIRDLRDKVNILPSSAKYKVYIIDEVHMLTREAFNALLKTLEEPPAHVIFILATTDVHKLPETIISRTQHFSFKPIGTNDIVSHLSSIADSEHIKADTPALELIAQHGGGSFRDSISLLDQASQAATTLTKDIVERLLGIAPQDSIKKLEEAVESGIFSDIASVLLTLRDLGFRPQDIAKQYSLLVRNKAMESSLLPQHVALLRNLLLVSASSQPEQQLELAFLEYALTNEHAQPVKAPVVDTTLIPADNTTPTEKTAKEQNNKLTTAQTEKTAKASVQQSNSAPKSTKSDTKTGSFSIELWPVVLSIIKKQYNTLYGILRMANATYANDTLTLSFKFAFHQKRINDAKNKQIITDIIHEQSGDSVHLECIMGDADAEVAAPAPDKSNAIDTVSNIFGGAEVLES